MWRWWQVPGAARCSTANPAPISPDCGGSTGNRLCLRKREPEVAVIRPIAATNITSNDNGLTVTCQLYARAYEKDITVCNEAMASLNVRPTAFRWP